MTVADGHSAGLLLEEAVVVAAVAAAVVAVVPPASLADSRREYVGDSGFVDCPFF